MEGIRFYGYRYWDKNIMLAYENELTQEQKDALELIANPLNSRYKYEKACKKHFDTQQSIDIAISNGEIIIQIGNCCHCNEMVTKLHSIIDEEKKRIDEVTQKAEWVKVITTHLTHMTFMKDHIVKVKPVDDHTTEIEIIIRTNETITIQINQDLETFKRIAKI